MPFTPSHIAAILPFIRTPLPAAGLVIGSMVPDLPYFVPLGIPREYTHSLLGAVTADLPMGIVANLVWVFVLRAPLLDLAPRWLHTRFRPRAVPGSRLRFAVLLLVALAVGVATHLLWDSFTHPDGFVVLHAAALRAQLGPFAVSRWLQYFSSVFGLVVLAIWAVIWARNTGPSGERYLRTGDPGRIAVWAVVCLVLVVVAVTVWIHGRLVGFDAFNRGLVYDTAVYSIAAAGAVGLLACLIWYVVPKRARQRG